MIISMRRWTMTNTKNWNICSFFCSVFISMYGFNQDSWLNLITLFNTNPSFKACFKFLMCITDSFLCVSWLQVLELFQFLFFQVQVVNHFEGHEIFYELFIKLRYSFNLLKAFYRKLVTLSIHINYLHPNAWIRGFFDVFIISSQVSMKSMTYSTSNTFFYHY